MTNRSDGIVKCMQSDLINGIKTGGIRDNEAIEGAKQIILKIFMWWIDAAPSREIVITFLNTIRDREGIAEIFSINSAESNSTGTSTVNYDKQLLDAIENKLDVLRAEEEAERQTWATFSP